MAIADDFAIDYANKRVYHTGSSTTIYGVNSLYTYLMDTFDELNQLDDTIPMTAQTPTEYTFTNAWFLNDDSVKYLASGSIRTSGYSGSIQLLKLTTAGYTAPATASIGLYVTDGNNMSGTLLAFDNATRKWWLRRKASTDIFNTDASTISVVGGTGGGTQSRSVNNWRGSVRKHIYPW